MNEKIVFEGSYEITPLFQEDVDSLRVISPRFLFALALSGGLLAGSWLLSAQSEPEWYDFVLGVMILVQLQYAIQGSAVAAAGVARMRVDVGF